MTNYFHNPSFEFGHYNAVFERMKGGFEVFRRPKTDEDGNPIEVGIPELQLPNGWRLMLATASVGNPYSSDSHNQFVRPETNVKHKSQIPPEEHALYFKDGDYCVKMFKMYGAWCAILYQNVKLGAGRHVVSVPLFADLVDHYDGNTKIPPEDIRSGGVRIDFDNDPGPWTMLRALENNVPTRVLELDKDKDVRIYIHLLFPYAIQNSGLFMDAVSVEPLGEQACENPAREPYDRVTVLLPQYVGSDLVADIAPYAYGAGYWSLGWSADDAGMGCNLKSRTVVVLDPKGWSGLKEFFSDNYPGINYIEAARDIPEINLVLKSPYTSYKMQGRILAADLLLKGVQLQYPTTHKNPYVTNQFGDPGPNYKEHNGLDLRSSYDVYGDESVATIGGKVVRAGYYSAEPWYGWQVRIQTTLPDGRVLLTRYAHHKENGIYVTVGQQVEAGVKLGKIDTTGNSTGDHLHLDVKVEGGSGPSFYADPAMLIDWKGDSPPPINPSSIYPVGSKGFVGTQALGSAANLLEYMGFDPPVFKTVLLKSELGLYKERVPNGHAIYRHWSPDEGGLPKLPDKHAAAREWINRFIDDLAFEMRRYGFKEVWIESVNEVYNNDIVHNRDSIAFDMAFIEELAKINAEKYPDLIFRPIVFTAAVGNPALPSENPAQWEEILPLARLCEKHNGAFGLHCYWIAVKDHPEYFELLAPWLQERYKEYDQWLLAHGVQVNWIMTEGGPVGGNYDPNTGGIELFASNGWKKAYDGDWQRTRGEYLKHNRRLYEHSLQYGFRFFLLLYQSGSHDNNWKSFAVEGEYLMDLGSSIQAENLP